VSTKTTAWANPGLPEKCSLNGVCIVHYYDE